MVNDERLNTVIEARVLNRTVEIRIKILAMRKKKN